MCLISVPHMKEIHPGEGWLKVIGLNRCDKEEEKCEENQAIFRNAYCISQTTNLIFFKFGM